MTSSYSTNLALDLMGTGDQSGTWGTTTNTNLGTLIEQAISGYVTQICTGGTDTITIPNGATGVARNMFLELTGVGGGSLVVPANKKLYFIYNNTSAAITVKVTLLTGVSVPSGRKVILVSNGTDIVEAHNAVSGNATVGGTLGVTGATTLSSTLGVTGALTVAADSSFTSTGAVKIPASTTLNRPSSPTTGQIRYNTNLGTFEGYGAAAWGSIGGGATGAGGDTVFQENQLVVTTSYTLSTNKSAMSVGPITINSGAVVTIPSGYRWMVL